MPAIDPNGGDPFTKNGVTETSTELTENATLRELSVNAETYAWIWQTGERFPLLASIPI